MAYQTKRIFSTSFGISSQGLISLMISPGIRVMFLQATEADKAA
jgi:hypothetical protein